MIEKNVILRKELNLLFQKFLTKGDTVLVHSSLSAFGCWFEGGPQAVIHGLMNAIGKDGTLVMPTATTSFSKTGFFNVNETPSETGLLTETFRKMKNVRRSCVPMASFAACGPDAKQFTKEYHSYLDSDSPFSALLGRDSKIMLFGIDYNRCTLYHLSEERVGCSYNFYKNFPGTLVSINGKNYFGNQRYFVRKDLTCKKDANHVGFDFEINCNVKVNKFCKSSIRVFSAREFDNFCMDRISENSEIFIAKRIKGSEKKLTH